MNKNQLLEQLDIDLEILRLAVERIKSEPVRQIDIELMHNKILQIYESFTHLKAYPTDISKKQPETTEDKAIDKIEEKSVVNIFIEAGEKKNEYIQPVVIKSEEAAHEAADEKNTHETISKQEVKQDESNKNMSIHKAIGSKTDKTALHEKFRKSSTSINDLQAGRQDKSNIADKMQKDKISDLRTAISLNQRMTYIKELFINDEKEFKKFIDFINRCENISEAKYYIISESEKRDYWNEKQHIVDGLIDLINRKFY